MPLLVAALVLLAGCSVEATVSVVVRDDGSGVVRVRALLDSEAVRAVESGGGTLETRVRLADLDAAGWRVAPWTRRDDGAAAISLEKRFGAVAEVSGIMREISGPDGPLRGVRVTRERTLVVTEYRFSGRAALDDIETGVPTDAELVQRLTADQVDVAALDQKLLEMLRQSFHLRVVVRLPGGPRTTFEPESARNTVLDASSTVLAGDRLFFLLAGGGFALLAVVVWVRYGRRRRHRAPHRPRHRAVS